MVKLFRFVLAVQIRCIDRASKEFHMYTPFFRIVYIPECAYWHEIISIRLVELEMYFVLMN